jgi:hypothetical protein
MESQRFPTRSDILTIWDSSQDHRNGLSKPHDLKRIGFWDTTEVLPFTASASYKHWLPGSVQNRREWLSFSPPLTNKELRTINPRASRQERPAPLSPSSVLFLSVAGQRPTLATAVKPRHAGLPEGHPGPRGFWPEGPAFPQFH